MKTLLLLATLGFVTSCGVAESLNSACGSDLRMGCNAIFGYKDSEQDVTIASVETKNNEQDARIALLESSVATMIDNLNNLTEDMDDLEDSTHNTANSIQAIVNANTAQLLSLSTTVTTLSGNLDGLNGNFTTLSNSLTKTIVDFIDPCSDGPGFDEVLMKTKDGKYIAYFEDGGKRHLSILNQGAYVTTDQQRCYFTINANGTISF